MRCIQTASQQSRNLYTNQRIILTCAKIAQYWAGYCSDTDDCPEAANGDVSPYAMTVDGSDVTVSNQFV